MEQKIVDIFNKTTKKRKVKRYVHSGIIETIDHLIYPNDEKKQIKLFNTKPIQLKLKL